MSSIKRILITGVGGSAGANFVKCLRMAKENFYLVGTDVNKYHLELVQGLDKKYILPPVEDCFYIDKLNQIIVWEKIDFVHPQTDIEVKVIAKNKKKIKAKTFLPSTKTINLCQNKMKLSQYLKKNSVPVPQSFHLKNKDDLALALKKLLKKNEKAWLRAIEGAGSRASLPIKNLEQGHQWIKYWTTLRDFKYSDFMLCEFLPRREFAFQGLWKNGEIVTSQARERLEYVFGNLTPSGQSSTPSVAKTVHREDINRIATKAIKAIDNKATGIFCIDMKENKHGIPCITEINCGRFFTTSNFFAKAGCNMPYYYVKLAFGEKLPDLLKYNAVPEGWYWLRNIDMGYKLIKGEKWTSKKK